MTATGEIRVIRREGWAVMVGAALMRWGRRRAIRADIAAQQRAAIGQERRAQLEEILLVRRELEAHRREVERASALQRLYQGANGL